MWAVRIGKLIEYFTGRGLLFGLLWIGLVCWTAGLVALLLTRWGQSRPLRKCLILSLAAHLLFVIYSTTVEIFIDAPPLPDQQPTIQVYLVGPQQPAHPPSPIPSSTSPIWEQILSEKIPLLAQEPARQPTSIPEAERTQVCSLPSELSMLPGPENLGGERPNRWSLPAPSKIAPPWQAEELRPAGGPEALEAPLPARREGPPRPLALEPLWEGPAGKTGIAHREQRALPGAPAALVQIPLPGPWVQEPAGGGPIGPNPSPPPQLATIAAAGSRGGDRLGASQSRKEGAAQATQAASSPPASAAPPSWTQLPKLYQARMAPNRQQWAAHYGATQETEKALQAALAWLAANQEPDGRWDAARHGAGKELLVGGRNRQGSGAQAHTGTTGLALLAFLGRGYTHQQGEYQKTVARGLEYLLRSQAPDGNLAGPADFYAFMYCHGIATLALGEAYGMTQDPRLREPLRQAITYTLAAQHPEQGGWRYRPREAGDTSQLGWQLMALKSAELAGLRIPPTTTQAAWRFLQSVSSGRQGGLASYRALETPNPAMTAEALVCRLFLGQPPSHPACQEASQYLLQHLPGQSEANLYYWYYGTLAMFQMGDPYWSTWNQALQKTLLARQQTSGSLAGSWDPDTRWDNYGGRVYSTALSALCLEVYYRYLPLYVHAAEPLGQPPSYSTQSAPSP